MDRPQPTEAGHPTIVCGLNKYSHTAASQTADFQEALMYAPNVEKIGGTLHLMYARDFRGILGRRGVPQVFAGERHTALIHCRDRVRCIISDGVAGTYSGRTLALYLAFPSFRPNTGLFIA